MDIGIIPEARDLEAIGAKHLDGLIGTGRTANVHQGFHGSLLWQTEYAAAAAIPSIVSRNGELRKRLEKRFYSVLRLQTSRQAVLVKPGDADAAHLIVQPLSRDIDLSLIHI